LAGEVLATYPRLDVLLNNVAGFWAHRHVTADGLEQTFALNHLEPYLLTTLLTDRLVESAPSRVVTDSSGAVLRAVGSEGAAVIGLTDGNIIAAMLAAMLAADHPELCRSLVLHAFSPYQVFCPRAVYALDRRGDRAHRGQRLD
jgi:NAD(P)-dependent dehydrogenase (short-subunit alcohol dehydrogenase family)